jgi:hypothetical protein
VLIWLAFFFLQRRPIIMCSNNGCWCICTLILDTAGSRGIKVVVRIRMAAQRCAHRRRLAHGYATARRYRWFRVVVSVTATILWCAHLLVLAALFAEIFGSCRDDHCLCTCVALFVVRDCVPVPWQSPACSVVHPLACSCCHSVAVGLRHVCGASARCAGTSPRRGGGLTGLRWR